MFTEKFKPVGIENKAEISGFLNPRGSVSCEMCFGNLFAWSGAERTEYYADGYENVLYLRNSAGYYFPVSDNPEKPAEKLLNSVPDVNFINLVKEQAEFLRDRFGFKLVERRDKSEYIYEAQRLRDFSGRKLHGKKNHLNKFYFMYGSSYAFESIGESNIRDCVNLSRGRSNWDGEPEIVERFAENYDRLGLIGGCVKIGGEVRAFTIGERAFAGSDCVIIHVEKADYENTEGIYPAVCSMFLAAHPEFNFVNREDDLGDAGLRQSKLSYRPLYLLERFDAYI